MPRINKRQATVYYAPTKNRRYFCPRSAAFAEARAMLDKKYTSEKPDYDHGQLLDPGWHWSEDDFLARVYKRLARLILKSLRKETNPN